MRLAVLGDVHDNLPALETAARAAAFRDRGVLKEGGAFARAHLLTLATGMNVTGRLFWHIDGFAIEAGYEDWVAIPDEIWDRAVSSFPWDDHQG
jgi:hypothetical protein